MTDIKLPDFDELWDYDDPKTTEEHFKGILDDVGDSSDEEYRLQLLTQVARTEGLQRRFDEAHGTLDAVEKALGDNHRIARMRYELERGRVFNSSGQIEAARIRFTRAWKLARASGEDFYTVDAAHMMGIAAESDKRLRWNHMALDTAENSKDPKARRWLGSLYNNIGWTYHDSQHYKEALNFFEKSLAFREKQGTKHPIRIAKWAVGLVMRSMGRLDEARQIQSALLKEWERDGEENGYVFEELGECLHAMGRADEARPYFESAFRILSKDALLAENEAGRLGRLKRLASGQD